ncbi:LacI family DNA-binding transcriptional regulator [Planktotalea arctica]|uniref:LacI family DNA-binding transcriptional regulator n=1 Tax=Planktotalea arctica TaxID=1481893 RepID=UPI00321A38DE
MSHRKVTSLEVAAKAGVSQSAVSRVFSGASASEKTAKKVRAAAQELGYRPNVLARSLITGRSRIIGLIVAYLDNQFYPVALERLSHALQEQGYHIMIFMASARGPDVDRVINELLDHQVDGIITASVGLTDALTERCEKAGIPVVMFNRGQQDRRMPEVTSDNLSGGKRIAEFLCAGGHERIGHISGWSGSSTGQDRAAGFAAGLRDAGSALIAQLDGMYSREGAVKAAREMVEVHKTDALFVGNDHMAFAVMDTLRSELGLRVPDDISIVGYDDVPMAAWAAYDLTTLRQPVNQMVSATVGLLMDMINGESTARKIQIQGPLVVRGSAKIPKG